MATPILPLTPATATAIATAMRFNVKAATQLSDGAVQLEGHWAEAHDDPRTILIVALEDGRALVQISGESPITAVDGPNALVAALNVLAYG